MNPMDEYLTFNDCFTLAEHTQFEDDIIQLMETNAYFYNLQAFNICLIF